MKKYASALFSILSMLLFVGCQSQQQDSKRAPQKPHLMHTLNEPVNDSNIASGYSNTHNGLGLNRLELQHQERLAAIEAQRAETIERFRAQHSRTIEELREKIKEIEAETALKLAQEKRKYAALLAEKEKHLKAMELNASLHRDQIQKAITEIDARNRVELAKLSGHYQSTIAQIQAQLAQKRTWILVGALFALLLLFFLFYRYRKRAEALRRQSEQEHEIMILQQRMRHRHIEKILEIIASKESDEALKLELAQLLKKGLTSLKEPPPLAHYPDQEKENPPL